MSNKMKHKYLISKDTPRQVREPKFQSGGLTIQTPDGWILKHECYQRSLPASVSDLNNEISHFKMNIDSTSTEDYTSVGLYSNKPYTMTGEVVITREQRAELLKQLVRI